MKNLPEPQDIAKILSEIKDPETGFNLLDLGIVKNIDYIPEDKKAIVYVDFKRRTPSCAACAPIAWLVQKRILDELSKRLMEYPDIKKVEVKE